MSIYTRLLLDGGSPPHVSTEPARLLVGPTPGVSARDVLAPDVLATSRLAEPPPMYTPRAPPAPPPAALSARPALRLAWVAPDALMSPPPPYEVLGPAEATAGAPGPTSVCLDWADEFVRGGCCGGGGGGGGGCCGGGGAAGAAGAAAGAAAAAAGSRLDQLLAKRDPSADELNEIRALLADGSLSLAQAVPGRSHGGDDDAPPMTRHQAVSVLQARRGVTLTPVSTAPCGGGAMADVADLREAVAVGDARAIEGMLAKQRGRKPAEGSVTPSPAGLAADEAAAAAHARDWETHEALVQRVAFGENVRGYGRLPEGFRYPYAGETRRRTLRRWESVPHGFGRFADLAGLPRSYYVGYVRNALPHGEGCVSIPGWGRLRTQYVNGMVAAAEVGIGIGSRGSFEYVSGAHFRCLSAGPGIPADAYEFVHDDGAVWRGAISLQGDITQEVFWTPASTTSGIGAATTVLPIAGRVPAQLFAPTLEEILNLARCVRRQKTGFGYAEWRWPSAYVGADGSERQCRISIKLLPSGYVRYSHFRHPCSWHFRFDDEGVEDAKDDLGSVGIHVFPDLSVMEGVEDAKDDLSSVCIHVFPDLSVMTHEQYLDRTCWEDGTTRFPFVDSARRDRVVVEESPLHREEDYAAASAEKKNGGGLRKS